MPAEAQAKAGEWWTLQIAGTMNAVMMMMMMMMMMMKRTMMSRQRFVCRLTPCCARQEQPTLKRRW